MTRFARAKGSKASNERLPNEATPWHVMKQQLQDVRSKSAKPERTKTAKELLAAKDEPFYCDTTGNVNNDWAEFDRPKAKKTDESTIRGKKKSGVAAIPKKKKKKVAKEVSETGNESHRRSTDGDIEIDNKIRTKKRKSEIAFAENSSIAENSARVETIEDEEDVCKIDRKKKTKKRKCEATILESEEFAEPTTNGETAPKIASKKDKSRAMRAKFAENSVIDDAAIDCTDNSKKKTKKRKSEASADGAATIVAEIAEKADEIECEPINKKKKMRKEKKSQISAAKSTEIVESPTKESNENENEETAESNKETSGKMSKRQKRNQKRKNKIASVETLANSTSVEETGKPTNSGTFDAAGNDWSSNVDFGKKMSRSSNDRTNENRDGEGNLSKKTTNNVNGPANNGVKRKPPKIRDDKEHKRRKPDVGSIKCTINGMDLEIVKYDGFPVKKEDAERLKDLRQQMILKGIPKSEINAAMKLERRKSEKALARIKKQVCFHCRKAGHNLSECPELGEGESATGICFKCGSTEHTHFECKVTKKQEYGFASCFICREQGHIAKQCPDNPKGLYPQGGCCKICGDVTHLRKDCPDLTKEKEENVITVGTIVENTLESLDGETMKKESNDEKKSKGKIVKF